MTVNVCQTCGKRKASYATRADARRVARIGRQDAGKRIRVYRCGPYFHLTSVGADRAAVLRAGRTTP